MVLFVQPMGYVTMQLHLDIASHILCRFAIISTSVSATSVSLDCHVLIPPCLVLELNNQIYLPSLIMEMEKVI